MRTGRLAALACVAALALSACGGLATSSPVRPGLEVGDVQANEVRVLPAGPSDGSTPVDVVTGFIRAGAATDDDYQVARSYLAPSPESTWRPDGSVMVFTDESSLTIAQVRPGVVRATAKVTGAIDSSGRYAERPPGSVVQADFGLRQVGGQWRIDRVPDSFGTWLSESDTDRLYDPFRVYFESATARQLVPDTRYFRLASGLATRLARALLGGVPAYLAGAVRTELPAGARLAVDAVPIDSGTATVDLAATNPVADPAQRQALAAQVLATVTQAPGVDKVVLQVDGTTLQVPGAPTSLDSLSALGFLTESPPAVKPILRTGTSLVRVDPEQVGDPARNAPRPSGAALPEVPEGWAYLALSRTGQEVAAVSGDRRQLTRWRGTTQLTVSEVDGDHLTTPTYDVRDVLWVGGHAPGEGRIWVLNTSAQTADRSPGPPTAVSTPWLGNRLVVSLRVSDDGQRVAVISTNASGQDPRLDVAGVRRQPDGTPTALSTPLTLAPSLTLMRDAVWVDDSTLAVLGRKSANQVIRPWFVPLGGPITAGPGLAGAVAITTVSGERQLVVTTDGGDVYIRAGNNWQSVGKGTGFLVAAR
ncbi:LpqB family beta-propeller domain-containing protein [Phycicoccus sp. M110.8]|uniref:LpqB family beta-propeller domain-containing protein n=1 Tax=Phycicoccus sp. M110.8 TaxID=3075433 RepID=UPI0028FD38CB|nr:LpqB family beta-propeller domain-containing protein [Phycicoccus sp. M110.8]MDU0312667.1 LpqB family beta-propeller domain-containing protein [Phycicoccus sp. M110.8]